MSQGKGGRRSRANHYKRVNIGDKGKEVVENIDENSPLVQQFRCYAAELDERHDRFERIVKLSRDITIESKRIIFLLHTIDKESKRDVVLNEAKARLDDIGTTFFRFIACELDNQDVYQYIRAFKNGLEEYMEATTFYQYLKSDTIKNWREVKEGLSCIINAKALVATDNKNPQVETVQALIIPVEYILGIADLTGELMRKCINNLATGDLESCYHTCNFVRNTFIGFLSCTPQYNKELNRKLYTLKQSLHKMENVCYTIKLRGSEIPKHILADVAIVATEDYADDEKYKVY